VLPGPRRRHAFNATRGNGNVDVTILENPEQIYKNDMPDI
jgi:hypothetical protein